MAVVRLVQKVIAENMEILAVALMDVAGIIVGHRFLQRVNV